MSHFSDAMQWVIYQQDYFWFLGALAWMILAVHWWRVLRPAGRLPWLPWTAAAGIATAGIEVSKLIIPVVMKPAVPPWMMWDISLGIVGAVQAAGWWWLAWRHRFGTVGRVVGFLGAAGVVAFAPLRVTYPAAGSWLTAIVFTLAAALFWGGRNPSRGERLALVLLVSAGCAGTAGPLAEALRLPHRLTEFSPLGPWSALLLFAATLVLLRSSLVTHAGLLRRQLLWLGAGLLLAAVMGVWARDNFERNILARVQMAAELIDRKVLAVGLDDRFQLSNLRTFKQQNGDVSYTASSAYLGSGVLLPVGDSLSKIEVANPDVQSALIQTIRGGYLVACCYSNQYPGDLADVGIYGPPSDEELRAWAGKKAHVNGPLKLYYGSFVQARAPLLSASKEMLGWLVFDLVASQWLAAQVQARLLAFAVVALGSLLLLTDFLRRQREREREEEARRAEIALGANRLKAAFLAKVSHELRTPIQSLLGFSELLRQRVADDPKAAGWLASLRQHGELMTRLVNDLIDLGALESGAFQLSPRPTDACAMTSQAIESFTPRAEAKGLALACFIDPAVPAWVTLDGERFRQVLINLVGNALKFTERGGVTVALRAEADDRLVLTVRDTGPGIAPAEQEKLFTAFSRLEVTADKEGSGLGLALSAGLCAAMGGALRVASDGRTGSCFTATFRAPPSSAPGDAAITRDPAALRGRRVLVVDDNPLVRELFIAFLTEHGAMCAAAGTGAEALAQGDASGFDAIILDLALPDGDGASFAGPLRERAREARIVGVSAHAGSADRQRALAAGMDAFLTKPVSLGALAAAITDAPAAGSPTFGTADALRERLARQFTRELPAQMTELDAAIAAENWPRVRALAHYLKNSAVVVRDDNLFSVCTGLEEAAVGADPESVRRWRALCEPGFRRWLAGGKDPSLSSAAPAAGNHNPNPR